MYLKNTQRLWAALLGLVLLTACQKEQSGEDEEPTPTPEPTPTTTEADKIKDTTIAYTRDIYLWYKQIPASFDARSYDGPEKIMEAIRQYSIEPGFTKPVDRYSFAIKQTEWNDVSSGISGDFGVNIFFRADGDLRVRSVEPASPAGKAGVRRGWRVRALNGSTNMTIANAEAIVNAVYYSPATTFKFEKPDGSTVDLQLAAATYQQQPLALDTVYNMGGKNIGYMVYNSFLGDSLQTMTGFSRIFSRFATAGVNDVIVDLRYNGGGYVMYQDALAGYLAPTAANGQVLMKQEFNDKYAPRYNSTTNVQKLGTLNLPRLFFIVSSGSASASELLINNLKAFMDVKLVGPANTNGKPVGYFPIDVADWYIFPIMFRSVNNQGVGNYFDGFTPDSKVADGLDKDWGDVTESCLAKTLQYITTGSFTPRIEGRGKDVFVEPSQGMIDANNRINQQKFNGMVDKRAF